MFRHQKRLICIEETYKRDQQKRPTKEIYKRDLNNRPLGIKRDLQNRSFDIKTDVYTSKETY